MTELAKGGFTGLIPAHAGSTNEDSDSGGNHRAHPRSRGEHAC